MVGGRKYSVKQKELPKLLCQEPFFPCCIIWRKQGPGWEGMRDRAGKDRHTGVERPGRTDLRQNPGPKDPKPMICLGVKLNFYTV